MSIIQLKIFQKKEFYKGIATGKIVVAQIVKEKTEFLQQNYSKLKKKEIYKAILDIIKFCNNTISTTPEIEQNIADYFKNKNNVNDQHNGSIESKH